jgi:hypothetical protein
MSVVHAGHHDRRVSFELTFKAMVGFAAVALVLVGLVASALGESTPFVAGLLSGVAGALVGALIARRVGQSSSEE